MSLWPEVRGPRVGCLKEAVEEETVPDDETAFKPRHKTLRGKLNVPRERFRLLTSKPSCYIWAGK